MEYKRKQESSEARQNTNAERAWLKDLGITVLNSVLWDRLSHVLLW